MLTKKQNLYSVVGKKVTRVDAHEKIDGSAKYVDDLAFEEMLFAKMVCSTIPSGRIKKIDKSRALKLKGVAAVLTAEDITGLNKIGCVVDDQPLLAADIVRFAGEPLAIVAAETRAIAEEAADLVDIEYEPLEPVLNVDESFAEKIKVHPKGNTVCHYKIRKGGDIDDAFSKSHAVFEKTFTINYQEHLYLETQGCIAMPENGGITVYASIQCPFYVQGAVATALGLPFSKVRIIQCVVGGGFGGKEDVPSEYAAKAALLAYILKKPVKLILDRAQDLMVSSKRHPMKMEYKVGVTRKGKINALKVRALADSGAYTTLSTVVLFRTSVHFGGPYVIPNVHGDIIGLYTNRVPCGAYRGFGTPQVIYAMESMINIICNEMGFDPFEFRRNNALKKGALSITSHKIKESCGLIDTIDKARKESDYDKRKKEFDKWNADPSKRTLKGLGVSSIFYGMNLGAKGWSFDKAGSHIQISRDGSITLCVGNVEMGQGAKTVLAQIAAEALGCEVSAINFTNADTNVIPDSGPTVASRTTVMSGNALLDAANKLRKKLIAAAAEVLKIRANQVMAKHGRFYSIKDSHQFITFGDLARKCYFDNIGLSEMGFYVSPKVEYDMQYGQGEPYYVYSYATAVSEVEVDKKTGDIRVNKMTCAHDVGCVINPMLASAQVEGGVAQGVGYAIMENMVSEKGHIKTLGLSTYVIPTTRDFPEVKSIFVEDKSKDGPYGAKGLGEPSLMPVVASVVNAVSNAAGHQFDHVPVLPERVWEALNEKKSRDGESEVK
jgi:CO/xanthine dehydrogenase Mo-binding subunit